MKPLAIVPTYMRQSQDLLLLQDCIESMRTTVGDELDFVIVDDGSPDKELIDGAQHVAGEFGGDLIRKPENEGFSRTVNHGLRRALAEGRDAILVNADIEFDHGDAWLANILDTPGSVIGAKLLYPNGTIQHAGVFFSLLTRDFGHIHQHGPGNLPESNHERDCPVTAALHLIRCECLEQVGLYDEEFRLGWEDVDYCIRVWQSGRRCVYQPRAIATHHESYFRSRPTERIMRWQAQSWNRLATKHAGVSFAEFVPTLALGEA